MELRQSPKKDLLVSIIIPAYNAEQFLDTAYENIKKQRYSKLEVIFVNDGSTDKTGERLNALAEKDGRIVVIDQENGGPGDARNAGLQAARGDLCAYVDVDDLISEDYISRMVECIGDGDICICKYKKTDEDKTITPDFPERELVISGKEAEAYVFPGATHTMMISPWCKLFRTEYLKGYPFLTDRKCEDEEWAYRTIYGADKVVMLPDILYEYKVVEGSDSHTSSFKRLYDTALNYYERMVFFVEKEMEYYLSAGLIYYDVISALMKMFPASSEEGKQVRRLYQKAPFRPLRFLQHNILLTIKIQIKLILAGLRQ